MTTIPCSAPHCGARLDPGEDRVQVDIPGHRFLLFCNVKCMWTWMSTEAYDGFRKYTEAS